MELSGTPPHAEPTRRRFLSGASAGVLLGAAGTACMGQEEELPLRTLYEEAKVVATTTL